MIIKTPIVRVPCTFSNYHAQYSISERIEDFQVLRDIIEECHEITEAERLPPGARDIRAMIDRCPQAVFIKMTPNGFEYFGIDFFDADGEYDKQPILTVIDGGKK